MVHSRDWVEMNTYFTWGKIILRSVNLQPYYLGICSKDLLIVRNDIESELFVVHERCISDNASATSTNIYESCINGSIATAPQDSRPIYPSSAVFPSFVLCHFEISEMFISIAYNDLKQSPDHALLTDKKVLRSFESKDLSVQRTIPTNSNHQAKARKIITVKSFGVGEGIIVGKVPLHYQFWVALKHASGSSFLLFCSLFWIVV